MWLESKSLPSICGGTTDWVGVEAYAGTLGPTEAFVDARERSVGHLFPLGCSGTLIGTDLFLTAGHCVSSSTPGNQRVRFNFQNDPTGVARTTDVFNVSAVLEDDLGGFDYAILQLDRNASAWGRSVPGAFAPRAGTAITIIQHPSSIPKVVEGGTLGINTTGRLTYEDLDTEGGSSGSGILQNTTGLVIGVHTQGTPDDACGPGDPNSGESMTDLVTVSPILRTRALDPAKVVAAVLH